ncbi:MAG TPA: SUF system NifU family Fe-S cluster assembly protein [candidate division Zixibacteria bacterium]|nr:SUF system NifU family Fe-S cluster assembly protein [candidate division Zixibacteria bacterium]
MSDLDELYQEVILDHNKSPRNFRPMTNANRKSEGYNPLCGDHVTVYLQLVDGVIADISFQGSGCAISKASASMMTAALKGKTEKEAEELFHSVHRMLTGQSTGEEAAVGKLRILAGVAKFPTRVKCATLAWHTANAALKGAKEPVTTE